MSEEDPTYPYRRCIEEVHQEVSFYYDNLCDLVAKQPENVTFKTARNVTAARIRQLDDYIDKYELRKELDI